jgi:hypothetical protein
MASYLQCDGLHVHPHATREVVMTNSQYTKPTLVDHGSIADHTFKPKGPKGPKKPTPPGFSA